MRRLKKFWILFLATSFLRANDIQTPTTQLPLYIEFGPCAECNYCHVIQYNLFPIFVALTQIQRNRTFAENVIYCNKYPFKQEVFKLISDCPIKEAPYDPATMYNLAFGFPYENKELCARYFSPFLSQLYERFNIKPQEARTHKITITLVQRTGRCRQITNLENLCQALNTYCARKNYVLNVVHLEKASFNYQLQLMANTDVLIACHGAAMTNGAFIRNNGLVIEIFPYGFKYELFHLFITNCRPDVMYHRWTLGQKECLPTTAKSKIKGLEFRYWRDQNIRVSPDRLIDLLDHLCKKH